MARERLVCQAIGDCRGPSLALHLSQPRVSELAQDDTHWVGGFICKARASGVLKGGQDSSLKPRNPKSEIRDRRSEIEDGALNEN